jgi:hypothetical protein
MTEPSRAQPFKMPDITWFGVIVPVLFAVAVLLGISHHELWRDEAKAWLIARHSDSLLDLFHNRRYEGHPIAWYALVYFASRAWSNPVVMQILHAVIAIPAMVVFVRWAPFGKLAKVLFAAGLFPMYEYAVVSRNYALGMLVLFVALALFSSPRRRPIAFALILVVLANTSLYGLLFAAAMGAAWIVRDLVNREWRTSDRRAKVRESVGLSIVIAGCVVAMLQIVPPPPASAPHRSRLAVFSEPRFTGVGMKEAVSRAWDSFVPIPTWRYRQFYGNVLRGPNRFAMTARFLASVVILGGIFVALKRSPPAVVFFAIAALAMIVFEAALFDGGLRHHGHLFIAMIAAVWLWSATTGGQLPRRWNIALVGLLSVHACVGAWYLYSDLRLPYSPSVQTAELLQKRYGKDFDLIADPANYASPVEAYLDVPVYFPARRSWGTFEVLDGTPKRAAPEELRDALHDLVARATRPVVLLSADAVNNPGDGLVLLPVASEPWSLSWEGWQVYEVRRSSDNVAGPPPTSR